MQDGQDAADSSHRVSTTYRRLSQTPKYLYIAAAVGVGILLENIARLYQLRNLCCDDLSGRATTFYTNSSAERTVSKETTCGNLQGPEPIMSKDSALLARGSAFRDRVLQGSFYIIDL